MANIRWALACLGLLASPAQADILSDEQAAQWEFKPREFVCPIGKQRFEQVVTHPHFPLQPFSDGSHLGDQWVEMQVAECPDNGLLLLPDYAQELEEDGPVYHAYSEAELAQLAPLIASAEYAALKGENRHYRAYWLAAQLQLPQELRVSLLQPARWSSDEVQRRSALELYAREMPGLLDQYGDDEERLWPAQLSIVDALRQLGKFEEGLAMLREISGEYFDMELEGGEDALYEEGEDIPKMRALLEAGNDDRFPIALQSTRVAGQICSDPQNPMNAPGRFTLRDCEAREAAQLRYQEAFDRSFELRADEEALAAMCEDADAVSSDEALEMACDARSFELDTAGAERLEAEQPELVASICRAGDVEREAGAMFFACISYRTSLQSMAAKLLVRHDAAFAAICEPQPIPYEEQEELYHACSSAERHRAELGALALWNADLPALRDYCQVSELEGRSHAQITACVWIDFHDEDNPPRDYVSEMLTGPLHWNELTRLAVPHAEELIARYTALRSGN